MLMEFSFRSQKYIRKFWVEGIEHLSGLVSLGPTTESEKPSALGSRRTERKNTSTGATLLICHVIVPSPPSIRQHDAVKVSNK